MREEFRLELFETILSCPTCGHITDIQINAKDLNDAEQIASKQAVNPHPPGPNATPELKAKGICHSTLVVGPIFQVPESDIPPVRSSCKIPWYQREQ